jgi:hypothetical protein
MRKIDLGYRWPPSYLSSPGDLPTAIERNQEFDRTHAKKWAIHVQSLRARCPWSQAQSIRTKKMIKCDARNGHSDRRLCRRDAGAFNTRFDICWECGRQLDSTGQLH